MAAAPVKRFRADAKVRRTLARLSRELEMSESDVIRRGIELVDRIETRKRGVEKLIEFLGDEPEPAKLRYRVKW